MQRETRHSHVAAGPQVNCAQWGCGQPEGRRPSDGAAWLSYGRPWPPGNHPILTTARPSWGSCEPLIRQTPVLVKQLHSVRCGEPSGALPWAGAGSWATGLSPSSHGPANLQGPGHVWRSSVGSPAHRRRSLCLRGAPGTESVCSHRCGRLFHPGCLESNNPHKLTLHQTHPALRDVQAGQSSQPA